MIDKILAEVPKQTFLNVTFTNTKTELNDCVFAFSSQLATESRRLKVNEALESYKNLKITSVSKVFSRMEPDPKAIETEHAIMPEALNRLRQEIATA
jgi:hypothetical protein